MYFKIHLNFDTICLTVSLRSQYYLLYKSVTKKRNFRFMNRLRFIRSRILFQELLLRFIVSLYSCSLFLSGVSTNSTNCSIPTAASSILALLIIFTNQFTSTSLLTYWNGHWNVLHNFNDFLLAYVDPVHDPLLTSLPLVTMTVWNPF